MDSNKNYLLNHNVAQDNECVLHGICSSSPTLTFLQEVIKSYLRELVFYLLKLKEYGISNEKIKDTVIDILSTLIVGTSYDEAQFSTVITKLYADLVQAKGLYTSICDKNNLKPEHPKSSLKKAPKTNLADIIRQGQKIFTQKNMKYTDEQKNLYNLIFDIAKSVCIHMMELKGLDVDDEEAYIALLGLINMINVHTDISKDLRKTIEEFVELDHKLLRRLHETKIERYGTIVPTKVPISIRENKAILVSGSNLKELELLLEATKNRGIDVYTHGHLIIAHAFPKFKKYPHLVGHYGTGAETYFSDFSSFRGAIFMTRYSMQRVENLYRSRIFTTDTVAPRGVVIIKDYNFEPLIESALSAKSFAHYQDKGFININLDESKVLKKLEEVTQKIENGEIKHVFALGVSNHTKLQKEYFEKFLNLLPEDCFLLSFSYTNGKSNVLQVESDYGFPLLYQALEIFTKNIKIEDLKPIILFTRCEVHTLSNVIYLNYIGVKNVYFTDCSPSLINPSVVKTVQNIFGLKKYTTPESDLKAMLNGGSE